MEDAIVSDVVTRALRSIPGSGELPRSARLKVRETLEASLRQRGMRSGLIWPTLEITSARKVLSVWESTFPSDDEPASLLDAAEAHLQGSGTGELSRDRLSRFKTDLDGKLALGEDFFASTYSGFAAWSAAGVALLGDSREPGDSELDIDPELWDASFYASLAYCGGAVWEEGVGDRQKRREFWEWFLVEAIPLAMSFVDAIRA